MGQQQLLLLVLATVIVGLAAVAGIQAFDENQTQATQDALVQRGTDIMSDLKGINNKPEQLGGVDLTASSGEDGFESTSKIIDKLGYDTVSGSDTRVPVDGASGTQSSSSSNPANCQVNTGSTSNVDGSSTIATAVCNSTNANQTITVGLTTDSEVVTDFS